MNEQLERDNQLLRQQVEVLRTQAEAAERRAAEAVASYEQQLLGMVVVRQQTEELDRLAQELAHAKRLDEGRMQKLEELNRELLARELENRRLIEQLSTPILQVWRDVLALPLVGSVDEERAATLVERLLSVVAQQRARHVIIDVTGTGTVDTATAAHLLRMSKAVSLLGASCILCGLQPEVAQAISMLGVSLDELHVSRNLHTALAAILAEDRR
jgi:rsbT co-antagonist protein RsbR